jgi:hypothetical protein
VITPPSIAARSSANGPSRPPERSLTRESTSSEISQPAAMIITKSL